VQSLVAAGAADQNADFVSDFLDGWPDSPTEGFLEKVTPSATQEPIAQAASEANSALQLHLSGYAGLLYGGFSENTFGPAASTLKLRPYIGGWF